MRSKTINLMLLILLLVVLSYLAWCYMSPPKLADVMNVNTDSETAIPSIMAQDQNLDVLNVPAITQYQEAIARPLFFPSRRPPQPEPPPPPPAAPPPPRKPDVEMQLIGVLITPRLTTAMIRVEGESKTSMLIKGDKIESWQLFEIKPNSVVLRQGDRSRELELLRNNAEPSMPPYSLTQKLESKRSEGAATDNDIAAKPHDGQGESEQAAAEQLRLRQERLKAIAERRRELLRQQRQLQGSSSGTTTGFR